MQNTRWISLLGPRARGMILAGGLSFCSWGCHQHYYYYGMPAGGVQGCPPGTTIMPSTVTTGPICDVPADGAMTGASSSRSTMISDGRKSRVVVSTPSSSQSSRFGWRPSDSESTPAITSVEGAYDDSSVKK